MPYSVFIKFVFSVQILQLVTRIAEVLLTLQQAGNVAYSGWMLTFNCTMYTDVNHWELQLQEEIVAQHVTELHTCAKSMENALREWKSKVKESRICHYELNYYSMQQLLRLRKELGHVRQNPGEPVDPMTLALLESISPEVTSENVHSIMSGLEVALVDLHAAADLVFCREVADTRVSARSFSGSVHTDSLINAARSTDGHLTTATTTDPPSLILLMSNKKLKNITEQDLSDTQKEILTQLVEHQDYSRLLVLKAIEDCPKTANIYDIQDWCDENDGIINFEEEAEEEEEEAVVSSDESSSESGSDDEDGNNYIFTQGIHSS